MTRLFNFAWMFGLMLGLLAANPPAQANEIVLSVEGGTAIMGDSGLDDVGPLKRDELATSWVLGGGIAYQMPLGGGRFRAGLAIDYLGNSDGDWGYSETSGPYTATIRQKGDIRSLGGVLSAEYDIMQASVAGFYPFVGAAIGVHANKWKNESVALTLTDGVDTLGIPECAGNDSSNTSFGWQARGGIGRDFGPVQARLFYQYVDRGDVDTSDQYACAITYNGTPIATGNIAVDPETIDLTSHEIRLRVSYQF